LPEVLFHTMKVSGPIGTIRHRMAQPAGGVQFFRVRTPRPVPPPAYATGLCPMCPC